MWSTARITRVMGPSTLNPFSISSTTSRPRSALGFRSKFEPRPPPRAHTPASTFYPSSHPTNASAPQVARTVHTRFLFLGKQRNCMRTAPIAEREHFRQSYRRPRQATFQRPGTRLCLGLAPSLRFLPHSSYPSRCPG